jgi:hypothetical protein
MPNIVKVAKPTVITTDMPKQGYTPSDIEPGEPIAQGEPFYIKLADGKAWVSQATAPGTAESDEIHGIALRDAAPGAHVVVPGIRWQATWGYSDGTAGKGKKLFLSLTKGRFADAPAFAGQKACGNSWNDGARIDLKATLQ